MPLGKLDRALRTDFPVHGRPHTFSLPTIYKVLLINNKEWNQSSDCNSDQHSNALSAKMTLNELAGRFEFKLSDKFPKKLTA